MGQKVACYLRILVVVSVEHVDGLLGVNLLLREVGTPGSACEDEGERSEVGLAVRRQLVIWHLPFTRPRLGLRHFWRGWADCCRWEERIELLSTEGGEGWRVKDRGRCAHSEWAGALLRADIAAGR